MKANKKGKLQQGNFWDWCAHLENDPKRMRDCIKECYLKSNYAINQELGHIFIYDKEIISSQGM